MDAWVRTDLFFGIAPQDASSARLIEKGNGWQAFLDREVTPRFPDGLSVYDVYGQWRSPGKADITHEHAKSLTLIYRDSTQHRADIEAIRAIWKKETGEESVLRVTQPVDVAF